MNHKKDNIPVGIPYSTIKIKSLKNRCIYPAGTLRYFKDDDHLVRFINNKLELWKFPECTISKSWNFNAILFPVYADSNEILFLNVINNRELQYACWNWKKQDWISRDDIGIRLFSFTEIHEKSYIAEERSSLLLPLKAIADYPVLNIFSTDLKYLLAFDKELNGGVFESHTGTHLFTTYFYRWCNKTKSPLLTLGLKKYYHSTSNYRDSSFLHVNNNWMFFWKGSFFINTMEVFKVAPEYAHTAIGTKYLWLENKIRYCIISFENVKHPYIVHSGQFIPFPV